MFGVLVRAIDVRDDDNAVVGCRNGTVTEIKLHSDSACLNVQNESHSDGEVWGLSVVDKDIIITTGDDNQIKTWSIGSRCNKTSAEIC